MPILIHHQEILPYAPGVGGPMTIVTIDRAVEPLSTSGLTLAHRARLAALASAEIGLIRAAR